jgi:Pentapeptide repeats (8 copies)
MRGVTRTALSVRTSGGGPHPGGPQGANLNRADLIDANLREANLNRAELGGAVLKGANLKGANLIEANLIEANLIEANLYGARLWMAKLSKAKLLKAVLARADLEDTKLGGADLRGAKLQGATLVRTDLTGADLTGCRIYGVSAWELKLETTKQQNLVITSENEPEITVDDIEVAQFIYLMLNNQKVRNVIDTITSKAVLILGRFTDERKAVLDALREELRKRNYLPILFDFAPSATRDITETVSLLARMSRFVVADITDAKSIPQELAVIVPNLPSVPVQPLLLEGSAEYSMFEHFKRYPWVLETYKYPSSERLIADLGERVIDPAEKWRSAKGAAAGPTG